jgi:hypothetical protein
MDSPESDGGGKTVNGFCAGTLRHDDDSRSLAQRLLYGLIRQVSDRPGLSLVPAISLGEHHPASGGATESRSLEVIPDEESTDLPLMECAECLPGAVDGPATANRLVQCLELAGQKLRAMLFRYFESLGLKLGSTDRRRIELGRTQQALGDAVGQEAHQRGGMVKWPGEDYSTNRSVSQQLLRSLYHIGVVPMVFLFQPLLVIVLPPAGSVPPVRVKFAAARADCDEGG